MPATFQINTLPTATLLTPNDANGRLAKMVMQAGSGWTSPRMEVSWTFTAGDAGQAQTQYELEIATSTTPSASGGSPSATIVSGAVASAATTATPTPSTAFIEGNYYFVRVRVNDGLEWSAYSGWFQCRVRWGLSTHRKDVSIAGAAPTSWSVTALNTTEPAGTDIVMEYNSSDDGTTNLGSWKADLSQPTKRKWVHYRAWFFGWGASPASRAQLLDITITSSGFTQEPDFWKPTPVSGQGGSIEQGKFVFGSQSLKMVGNGAERIIYQQVKIEPNTDYVLQGRIESQGNSGASIRLADTAAGAALVNSPPMAADAAFALLLLTPWNSGNRTTVFIQTRINGAVGTAGFFDGIKIEKGRVASSHTPSFVGIFPPNTGSAAVVDGGGVQVDASKGGVVRLRGSTGGGRDVTELGTSGLRFGGPTNPVEVSSDTVGNLKVADPTPANAYVTAYGVTDSGFAAALNGEAQARAALVAAGLSFGSGAGARDVDLSRAAANILRLAAGDRLRHDFPGVIAFRSAVQSLASNTVVPIQLNSADVSDQFLFHDPVTNNTRLIVPAGWDGTYLVWGTGQMAGHTGVRNIVGFGINGAAMTDPLINSYAVISGVGMGLLYVGFVELVATNYLELNGFQSSAGAVNFGPCYAGMLYLGESA